ncbi:MAG: thioredoxin domain-containing protein [bacterium]|nr:thioredoxin domain-containing protein [bacterium]
MRTSSFIIFLTLVVLIAGFVGALAFWTFQPPTPPNLPSTRGGNESLSPPFEGGVRGGQSPTRPVIASSDPLRGDPAASIAIVEFGDFFCPACAEIEPVLASVLEQYKGKVKLVWKDLPNTRLHPLAQKAAEAARCAGEQGKFWEYHDLLFKNQDTLTETAFTQFAREINMNIGAFEECLNTGAMSDIVNRSFNEGLILRVDATPYFFIGDRRFSGAISETELKETIENAL